MKTEFSRSGVSEILGINQERFREWVSKGYIKPSIQSSSGSGTRNLFSRIDLYRIGLFRLLLASGFSRTQASVHVNGIGESQFQLDLPDLPLYYTFHRDLLVDVSGHDFMFSNAYTFGHEAPTALFGLAPGGDESDDTLVVNIRKMMREIDSAIGE